MYISERTAIAKGNEAVNRGKAKRFRVKLIYTRNKDGSVDLSYRLDLFV